MQDRMDIIKDLTLMLLYLTSWEERIFKESPSLGKIRRSWKGYDFDTLDKLAEEDLISASHRTKSVLLRPEAAEKALELLKKYGIEEGDLL
jgi:hypothetical protein